MLARNKHERAYHNKQFIPWYTTAAAHTVGKMPVHCLAAYAHGGTPSKEDLVIKAAKHRDTEILLLLYVVVDVAAMRNETTLYPL